MAYHTEWPIDKRIEELPYKIIPGEVGNFRNDVFRKSHRRRTAAPGHGTSLPRGGRPGPVSDGIEAGRPAETYYTPPLINVIKFACNACAEKRVMVTDGLPGLSGTPLCGGLPQGCGEPGPDQREIQDRSGEVH